jgi:hypothetical protein
VKRKQWLFFFAPALYICPTLSIDVSSDYSISVSLLYPLPLTSPSSSASHDASLIVRRGRQPLQQRERDIITLLPFWCVLSLSLSLACFIFLPLQQLSVGSRDFHQRRRATRRIDSAPYPCVTMVTKNDPLTQEMSKMRAEEKYEDRKEDKGKREEKVHVERYKMKTNTRQRNEEERKRRKQTMPMWAVCFLTLSGSSVPSMVPMTL